MPAALAGLIVAAFARYMDADFVGTDTLAAIRGARIMSLDDAATIWARPLNTGSSFAETQAVFYRPIATLVFSLDQALWGLDARGYHLTNALIQAAVGGLAYGMLRSFALSRTAAVVGAALVGLHPSMAAAVPVIARRYDALSVACLLLSVILLRRTDAPSRVGSVIAFGAALLCKESAFGFAPLLVLVAWARCGSLRDARAVVPHLLVAAVLFGIRYAVLGTLGGHAGVTVLGGADWGGYQVMLARYVQFLVWPLDAWVPGTTRGAVAALALATAVLTAAALGLPGRHRRVFLLGSVWVIWFAVFFTALLHMAGPWYMYYPLGGVALMFGSLIDGCRARLAQSRPRLVLVGLPLAGMLGMAVVVLPTTPLVHDYGQWRTAGAVARSYLGAASECIQQLMPGDAITFWNLPRDMLDGSRETEFLAVTLLESFSMEAYLDLVRPGAGNSVFVGSSVRLTGAVPDLELRCERPAPGRVRLIASGTGLPPPELPP